MNQEEETALQKFYIASYEEFRHRNVSPEEGTCTWIFEHPQYREWINQDQSSLLWVSADPGCGKSVLASFLVNHFRQTIEPPALACHFFFRDDSQAQRSAETALCSVIHQLLSAKPNFINYAVDEVQAKGDNLTKELSSLWDIFVSIIDNESCGTIYLILDGLDECEEKSLKRLLKLLRELHKRKMRNGFLMTIVTSRPYQWIRATLDDAPTIRLKTEDCLDAIDADVHRVINVRIDRFGSRTGTSHDARLENIRRALSQKADRTFLWITLVLDIMDSDSCQSFEELNAIVDSANKELESIYEKILSRSKHPEKARKLLSIVLAASEPLTLEQLDLAFAIQSEHKRLEDVYSSRFVSVDNGIRDACGMFLRVSDGHVVLVHQTAREFLLTKASALPSANPKAGHIWSRKRRDRDSLRGSASNASSTDPSPFKDGVGSSRWQGSFSTEDCILLMAGICISYLLLEEFRLQEDEMSWLDSSNHGPDNVVLSTRPRLLALEASEPFSHHCFVHWAAYYARIQSRAPTAMRERVMLLLSDAYRLAVWVPFSKSYGPARRNYHKARFDYDFPRSTIGRAWYLGFAFPELHSNERAMNGPDRNGYVPLFYAALNGNPSFLSTLIDEGAHVDGLYTQKARPLFAAVAEGDVESVKILLEAGAGVNIQDEEGRTPLFACYEASTMHLLLDHGVDVSHKNFARITACEEALRSGSKVMLEVLLSRGFTFDQLGGISLLFDAIQQGSSGAVEILLDADPKILDSSGNMGKALGLAIRERDREILSILLKQGTNQRINYAAMINSAKATPYDELPLHFAARMCDQAIVLLLLENGADVRIRDGHGRTALATLLRRTVTQARTVEDAIQVADILLKFDADVNALDDRGRTPLHLGLNAGTNPEILDFLLTQGADILAVDDEGRDVFDYLIGPSMMSTLATFPGDSVGNMLDLLVSHGFQLELRNTVGQTPLIRAVKALNSAMTKGLLAAGADSNATDNVGRTARSYALELSGLSNLLELFDEALSKANSPEDVTGSVPHINIEPPMDTVATSEEQASALSLRQPTAKRTEASKNRRPAWIENSSMNLGYHGYTAVGRNVIQKRDRIDRAQTASPFPQIR